MKKIITAIYLTAIMLLCGCGADSGSIIVTSVPRVSHTAEDAQASTVNFTIPRETKVFVRPEELTPLKPLFESYLKGNDMLSFVVSSVFDGNAYLIGFVYENNEGTLPISRVIGLKQTGTGIEEAFISDNNNNSKGWEPENLVAFEDEMFYDTQTFETSGMLVVKTNEFLSEDAGFYNFFLINEEGLLDNHININLNEPCELFEYNGKLLLNESCGWYEFTVKDKKIVLNEIMDFEPYLSEISESDFVITLKEFKPGTYDGNRDGYNDNGYFKADIDRSVVLTKEDFNLEEEEYGYGYLSKKAFKINIGDRIILLYPPGMKTNCHISGDMDDTRFEYSSLPGVEILRAQEPGEYTAQIENDDVYVIYITAE